MNCKDFFVFEPANVFPIMLIWNYFMHIAKDMLSLCYKYTIIPKGEHYR